jgi:serine/threonine protein kinase
VINGGELFSTMLKQQSFNEEDVAKVIKDVLLAMTYSHQLGIAHRNIRPETVMIDFGKNPSKNKNLSIKVTDFMQGAIGTPADKILKWDPKTK